MHKLIAILACTLVVADAIGSDAHEAKPQPAVVESAPKTESSKPPIKESPMEAGKSEAAVAKAQATAAKEARIQREMGIKIAARLAELRKERAARLARQKALSDAAHSAAEKHNQSGTMAFTGHAPHWSYEGEGGPIHWGKLNPAWAKCDSGERQSPIDIRDGIKVDLEQVNFDYKPARFNVLDNGHTIQVNLGPGNYITVVGRIYELVQFHFHRPSEERVNGRGFQMVAHLVHKNADGRLAVVAVMIEEGKAHNLVQSIWNNLPLEKNETVSPSAAMDLNQLLPERREYYTYMGSLTTPPCSEGVLWIVFKEPIHISSQQIAIFARLYPMNARPIQTQAGRLIKESN